MDSFIYKLNNVFRPPNVAGRESEEAYSEWEHHWGRELSREYLEPAGDVAGKTVLDVGCGLGGKTVAYGEAGARAVIGTDIATRHIEASREYATGRMPELPWGFFTSDAASLPLGDACFDTVVANDAMEHFPEPGRALGEMRRVTRQGGAIWIFFTPHFSPLGSHLYDYLYTPWCHVLFTRSQLERAITRVVRARMAGEPEETVAARVGGIMASYDNDLNHMSIRKFLRIVREVGGLRVSMLELRPIKFGALRPLTRLPGIREFVTGFVVCRLEKVAA
jgi:ubiquinone/menaquinone biosynthesis C-methylase UbiE